jgi:hypothetical protein
MKVVISTVLAVACVTSYIYFVRYHPKLLSRLEDVRGASTSIQVADNFPYPQDAKKVSTVTSESNRQVTFETGKTPEQVQSFYKAVLTNDQWELRNKTVTSGTIEVDYKQDKKTIEITVTPTDDTTSSLVNVKLSN